MIGTGFALAILTTAGAIAIYMKLPEKVRHFITKHSLLTDVLTLIGVYYLLGGTITALFAAAICGLAVSIMLHTANHPDDYMYLADMKVMMMARFEEMNRALKAYGQRYREQRIVPCQTV